MYRVNILSGKAYAVKIDEDNSEEEMSEIQTLAMEGTPSFIVYDLEDVEDFDLDPEDVVLVERD